MSPWSLISRVTCCRFTPSTFAIFRVPLITNGLSFESVNRDAMRASLLGDDAKVWMVVVLHESFVGGMP